MRSGATRVGLGDESTREFVAAKLNAIADPEVRKDFWDDLDPVVQTTAVVIGGLLVIRVVRALL